MESLKMAVQKHKTQLYIGLSALHSLAFTFCTQGVAVGLGYTSRGKVLCMKRRRRCL
ncbi:MAG: hypothetical protein LBT78_04010 [Tannerella sp.]|nr:hypothetical protein [Tannerella sp.]